MALLTVLLILIQHRLCAACAACAEDQAPVIEGHFACPEAVIARSSFIVKHFPDDDPDLGRAEVLPPPLIPCPVECQVVPQLDVTGSSRFSYERIVC